MTSSAEVLPAASPASGELLAAPGSLLAAGERVAATCATPRAVSGSATGAPGSARDGVQAASAYRHAATIQAPRSGVSATEGLAPANCVDARS